MAKKKPLLGQITFRVPSGVHEDLLEVARVLNLDLTARLNQMIAEAMPETLRRASELVKRQRAAREDFDSLALPKAEGPLVLLAVEEGRKHELHSREQVQEMAKVVGPK